MGRTSLGIVTSAGALSSIIPPSMVLIVYGICSDTSVGDLFKGGVLPGILIVILLSIYLVLRVKPSADGKPEWIPGERKNAIIRSLPVLAVSVITLGGIYGGFFSPTEAGAARALYSFVPSVFILRDISFKKLLLVFRDVAKTLGQIFMLIGCSTVFSQALNISGAPKYLTSAFSEMSPIMFLFVVNILLLIMGCFFDAGASVMILVPLLLPIAEQL